MPDKVTVAVGSDHAGFALKESVRGYLEAKGFTVEDCGVHSPEPADYPDYAERVASRVARGKVHTGVLMCGTGLGVSIAANKVEGIRAAVCNNTLLAYFARAHNDANVLTMGGRIVGEAEARRILDTWFSTPFEGGRHEERVEKISAIEKRQTEENKS